MALPSVLDLKEYLRIEHTSEDALIKQLLQRAVSTVEMYLGQVPITAISGQTAIDPSQDVVAPSSAVTRLLLPYRPIAVQSVVSASGETVPSTDYLVRAAYGFIDAVSGVSFDDGPYTITYQYGLSLMPTYQTFSPVINAAIIDVAADLYQRRTSSATSTTSNGTSISWDVSSAVAARVAGTLRAFRRPVLAI